MDGIAIVLPPLILIVLLTLYIVRGSDLLILCGLIVLFGPVSGYEEGFQLSEAVYGVAYLSYLAIWFITKFSSGWRVTGLADNSLLIFLVWVTISFPLTMVFGGDLKIALSEWLALSTLAFYFPIKEQIVHNPKAIRALAFSCLILVVYIAVRNFVEYATGLSNAEHLWAIAKTRVTTNELVMLSAATACITLFVYVRSAIKRVGFFALSALFIAAVVITQSRALWVSQLLAVGMLFLLSPRQVKNRFLVFGFSSLALLLLVAPILLEDFTRIVSSGLISRLLSLESATVADISLINRFVEARVAFEAFLATPITGYGLGVPYKYYSLVYELSWETTFIHNTVVGVLYKHGLVGFILLLLFGLSILVRAFDLVRKHEIKYRVFGVVGLALICAFALDGLTSNLFTRSDISLNIAIVAAVICGVQSRLRSQQLGPHRSSVS